MGTLDGRRAVVTGSAAGIGRVIAGELAPRGAPVAILDIDGEAAQRTADEIAATWARAVAIAASVADPDDVRRAFAEVDGQLGGKAAVEMMTRALAIEWAEYGVRVNGVAPAMSRPLCSRPLSSRQ